MKDKLYFWYSEGQRKVLKKSELNRALIKGQEVEYTECSQRKKAAGLWDDYVYLGKGAIYKVNGVLQ